MDSGDKKYKIVNHIADFQRDRPDNFENEMMHADALTEWISIKYDLVEKCDIKAVINKNENQTKPNV